MCGFGLFVRVKEGMLEFVETVLFGPRVVGWIACVWDGLGRGRGGSALWVGSSPTELYAMDVLG